MARPSTIEIPIVRAALKAHPRRISAALTEVLRSRIMKGGLASATRLPASRAFARELGVARNVVTEAYAVLAAEGLVSGRAGVGTVVQAGVAPQSNDAVRQPANRRQGHLPSIPAPSQAPISSDAPILFEPCVPDVSFLDEAAWRSCWRRSLRRGVSGDYQDPAGEAFLRTEIAHHLSQTRGWTVGADDVLVTNGALEALNLLARVLIGQGDWIGMETPGWPAAREALRIGGFEVRSIKADLDGLDIDDLARRQASPRAVIVTPAHQFPLGGRLPADRRRALIAWAERHDAWIIEDDYDSAFRFDVPALPALAAMDANQRIAHVGSFSKTLAPALRIGYVIGPAALRERLRELKLLLNYHTATFGQLAIAQFMADGLYERHLARMRRLYSGRRQAMVSALRGVSALRRLGHDGTIEGIEAGLHLFWRFPSSRGAKEVADRLARSALSLTPIEAYSDGASPWHGFLAGFTSPRMDTELSALQAALTVP
ncbi:GntR family transcriptional regulator / MocR family aminotransferase [Rhizobiales bacterium GAS191]|nr:GntR family transcriptional regulator / MocR family aminotransferase [Rhizobiales bacterium GAS191]